MMTSFNLLNDSWIPLAAEGRVREVGIREALLNAHEEGDPQATSPLETAALLRLLLAVVFAACGPTEKRDWKALWRAGRFPQSILEAYLSQWEDRFDLFGERPFLQVANMTMAQPTPLTALATEAATGNNATLFDHAHDDDPPAFTPAEAARKLLAAQGFALGFGKAAEAVVNDKPFPRPYLADGICLRGVTIWLSGKSLFETLMLNLVPGKQEDRPLWERGDPLERLDRVKDGKRISVRAKSGMERYVWQSRMVRLLPQAGADGHVVVRRAFFTQGREADKAAGDPMKVFVESKTEGSYPLGLNAGKASWRDMHSLLAFNKKVPSNPILRFAAECVEEENIPKSATYGFNIVGLATDPGKAGKFLLWRHDRLSVPAILLEDEFVIDRLGIMLRDAEFVAGELRRRMYFVIRDFVPPHGNPDPKDVARLSDALDPRPAYWARLENHFLRLLAALPNDQEGAVKEWRRRVEQEAERALRESIRLLGHTRQAFRATATVSFRFQANEAAVTQRRDEMKKQTRLNKTKKEEKDRELTTR